MFCGNCGNFLPEDARFCNICGAPQDGGMYMSFYTPNGKPWAINDTSVIFDNRIVIEFSQITDASIRIFNNGARLGFITINAFGQVFTLAFSFEQREAGKQAFQKIQENYGSEQRKAQFRAEMETDRRELVYQVQGVRGRHLKVYSDRAVIKVTAGIGSFMTGNISDGEKTIYYIDCVGLQFKESGFQIGYLQFETAANTMNQANNNFFNENSFTFDLSVTTNEHMKEIRDYVQKQIRELKSGQGRPIQAAPSPADELKKFKELLDMGAITQEEFDIKKKQLLGL